MDSKMLTKALWRKILSKTSVEGVNGQYFFQKKVDTCIQFPSFKLVETLLLKRRVELPSSEIK